MTALAHENTVPAFPLGCPSDRPRYGMTPEQAALYRWLVLNRPHNEPFLLDFHGVKRATGMGLHGASKRVEALVERGWLRRIIGKKRMTSDGPVRRLTRYAFVHPVMMFRAPRHG